MRQPEAVRKVRYFSGAAKARSDPMRARLPPTVMRGPDPRIHLRRNHSKKSVGSASSRASPDQEFLHPLQNQLAALVEHGAAQRHYAGGAAGREFGHVERRIDRIIGI